MAADSSIPCRMKLEVPDIKRCVYLAQNMVNGNYYVGKTNGKLRRRIRAHFNDARRGSDKVFHRAIRKHGAHAFVWSVLIQTESEDELNRMEAFYIKEYDTLRNGYNSTEGGEGISGYRFTAEQRRKMSMVVLKRPVVCTNTGKEYRSIRVAAEDLGLDAASIHTVCAGKCESTVGYAFEYLEGSLCEAASKKRSGRKQRARASQRLLAKKMQAARRLGVRCMNTGKEFSSLTAAAREYGVTRSQVATCCLGKSDIVRGLVFEYIDQKRRTLAKERRRQRRLHRENIESENKRPVQRIKDGKVYESASEAARENGVDCSSLIECCRGKRKSLGGVRWEYNDETLRKAADLERRKRNRQKESNLADGLRKRMKPVVCVETGVEFESVTSAAQYCGITVGAIQHCLKGRNKTAGGYRWQYK